MKLILDYELHASKTSAIIDRIINNSREFCKILNAAPVFLI